MKLYTEEQLNNAYYNGWNDRAEAYMNGVDGRYPFYRDKFVEQLTPIELQSDEEIEARYYKELEDRREAAKNFKGQVAGRHPDMFGIMEVHHMVTGYLEFVKWMREQIQGGNK